MPIGLVGILLVGCVSCRPPRNTLPSLRTFALARIHPVLRRYGPSRPSRTGPQRRSRERQLGTQGIQGNRDRRCSHRWANGGAAGMNRTIEDATLKLFHNQTT